MRSPFEVCSSWMFVRLPDSGALSKGVDSSATRTSSLSLVGSAGFGGAMISIQSCLPCATLLVRYQ